MCLCRVETLGYPNIALLLAWDLPVAVSRRCYVCSILGCERAVKLNCRGYFVCQLLSAIAVFSRFMTSCSTHVLLPVLPLVW